AYEHNVYTEGFDITYQFNRFGPLKAGAGGNNLKDRSAGLVVRYNWIEGGNRQLDLVDSHNPLIAGDPRYRQTFVYGNVLIERLTEGNRQIVMYGGDSGDTPAYRNGTLYFYNNTVVSYRTDRTTLFGIPTNDQRVDARNNIFYVTAAGNTLSVVDSAGFVDLLTNWFKPGFVSTFSSLTGMVNGGASSIVGTSPGFADESTQDFRLAAGSPARDAGTVLSTDVLPAHLVTYEYVKHLGGGTRPADAAIDIGAYEMASGGTVSPLQILTTSVPPGEAGTPYTATLSASGGVAPYFWSITSGQLPAGLTLDGGSGVIAGTPGEPGTFGLTLQVAGSDSNAASASVSLVIASPPAQPNPVRIAILYLPDARRNKTYRQTLTGTGGVQPYLWALSTGVLPPGLSLNSSTGLITGRPTTAGTWSFVARVSDQQSPVSTDQRPLAITVR
ncbi:MAG: Ig domain-containing protein, partial [Acidobacteria bacterium]|nr:Ig domain-containing protein [Acidobacteriota bacterium]